MAIERRFSDIRTTQPISFNVYRDCFCFIGDPMETEDSKEGEVAPQEVHAYLMCDEAELCAPFSTCLNSRGGGRP